MINRYPCPRDKLIIRYWKKKMAEILTLDGGSVCGVRSSTSIYGNNNYLYYLGRNTSAH